MDVKSRTIIDTEATAKKLKDMCYEKGITPGIIADNLGFSSVTSVYKWFSGKSLPRIDNLVELGALLDTDITNLIVTKKI